MIATVAAAARLFDRTAAAPRTRDLLTGDEPAPGVAGLACGARCPQRGVVVVRAGSTAAGRGTMAPVDAARGRDDGATEHTTPECLHDHHHDDDFWDDVPRSSAARATAET